MDKAFDATQFMVWKTGNAFSNILSPYWYNLTIDITWKAVNANLNKILIITTKPLSTNVLKEPVDNASFMPNKSLILG